MEKPHDIHDRIYKCVIRVFVIIKTIPHTLENKVIIHQIAKSVTSMGANDQEADAAISRRDFIAKYSIVKKETKETLYWMKVIRDLHLTKELKEDDMVECQQILSVVSSIILSAKRNQK